MNVWEKSVKNNLDIWEKKLESNKVDTLACEAELERLKEFRLEINCAIELNKNRLKISQKEKCQHSNLEENEH